MSKAQQLIDDGFKKEGAILRSPNTTERPIAVVHLERVIWFTEEGWTRITAKVNAQHLRISTKDE